MTFPYCITIFYIVTGGQERPENATILSSLRLYLLSTLNEYHSSSKNVHLSRKPNWYHASRACKIANRTSCHDVLSRVTQQITHHSAAHLATITCHAKTLCRPFHGLEYH